MYKINDQIRLNFFYYCYKVLLKPFNYYLENFFLNLSFTILIIFASKRKKFFSEGCINMRLKKIHVFYFLSIF